MKANLRRMNIYAYHEQYLINITLVNHGQNQLFIYFVTISHMFAGPVGRAAEGLGMQPLDFWDRPFESR
jgi:hypothetical protein